MPERPDPAGPVRDLRRRLEAEAARLGLEVESFEFTPDLTGKPDLVEVLFTASDEQLQRTPDDIVVAAAFDDITAADHERSLADRAAQARADMARRLAEGGDLLGD